MDKKHQRVIIFLAMTIFSALIFSGCVMDQFARTFNDCCFSPAAFLPLGFLTLVVIYRTRQ